MEKVRRAAQETARQMDMALDALSRFAVHFLDMGTAKYGDCIVVEAGKTRVLVDGGHPGDWRSRPGSRSIPQQLGEIFESPGPFDFDLLIVTHTHRDHIGCLPALVENGQITARRALVADPGLGYGSEDSEADDSGLPQSARLAALAAREESHASDRDPAALWELLLDAGRQQTSYREMLRTLEARGTRVVTFLGSDDDRPEYRELLEEFRDTGLRVLGPTREHLQICAGVVDRVGRDSVSLASDAVVRDGIVDAVDLYRRLAATADAGGLNAALNDQSLVAVVERGGRKLLLTGDMQFAEPGVPGLSDEMRRLRDEISAHAPYDVVKIAHHASENAFDAAVLEELKESRLFVISTGRDPRDSHPAPEVLDLLHRCRDDLEWLRTDRNGLISLILHEERVRMLLSGGETNDESPNGTDAAPPLPVPEPVPEPLVQVAVDQDQVIELKARVPRHAIRVTFTVDLQPQAPAPSGPVVAPPSTIGGALPRPLQLASGRSLPPLLFVTGSQALAGKIGQPAVDLLLRGLRQANMAVLDVEPALLGNAADAASMVQETLRSPEGKAVRGVVLLGGYDVIPSQRLQCIDEELEEQVEAAIRQRKAEPDLDRFIVWSDDIYGDLHSDFPLLPVSRVPDGGSAALVWAALEAGEPAHRGRRSGVRNFRRIFAEPIFGSLPGTGDMLPSEPAHSDQSPPIDLAAEYVYLMLHGEHWDATQFLGESVEGDWPRAVALHNVTSAAGAVVFAGCCWGALAVHEPAVLASPGATLTPHTADSSLALRFLAAGARAFVGCTGVHYSPRPERPNPHFGSPLHDAFWRACCKGVEPARALREAKVTYLRDCPHGLTDAFPQAVELKTLRQFTCLGLGW